MLFVLRPWFIILNTILGIVFIEYALKKTKSVRKVDEARDSKFSAFRRWDVSMWSRPRLYLAAPLVPFRFFTAIGLVALHLPITKLVLLIGGPKTPLRPWQRVFLKYLTIFVARATLFVGAFLFYYKHERPKADYKKYLGPEWKPVYEGASTVVANHSSWIDINLITVIKFPSFTPKLGIKKWPVIGTVCDVVFNSLFINRAGTPEER